MKNKSNLTVTKDGLIEKSTGRKIVSPLDLIDKKSTIKGKENESSVIKIRMS